MSMRLAVDAAAAIEAVGVEPGWPGPGPEDPLERSVEPLNRTRNVLRAPALALALVAGLCLLTGPARAEPLEVPDPEQWSQLAPAEQAARQAAIAQRLQQATPAEREAFRRALRERLERLTPAQRQALADRAREHWERLPPQERERLLAERRARVQAMSPAERRQWLQQRQAILEQLSPQEREALRQPLPTR